MTSLKTIILTAFCLWYAQGIGVEILERTRSGNIIRFVCRERLLDGVSFHDITNPIFYLNSSQLVLTTLLEERNIAYEYDPVSKQFSFNVQQDLEGCYYCGNSTVLSNACKTIVAYPDRDQSIQRHYEVPVGQPVRLLNGVGEGALASHYHVRWRKGFNQVAESERIRYEHGDDLSLFFTSVEVSDSATYCPTVEVSRTPDEHYGNPHNYYVEPEINIDLVVYRSPEINTEPSSVVAVQGSGPVSFLCVASGGPNLRVSWIQNMNKNLTSKPNPRYLITPVPANDTVTSRLVIQNATHLDSGSFHCVAYIMDRVDELISQFVTVASATLTVLDAKFQLQTRVTDDKELQIWISLQVPLPDPVRAVVCFTSTKDEEIQRHYVTSSSQTNSTALFFLLHFPDIPEDIRDGSFKVQVGLKAGLTEGPLVPSGLEEADTRNINEPTENNCEEGTKKILIITAGGVLGALVLSISLLLAALAITFGRYMRRRRVDRGNNRNNLPDGRYEDARRRIDELKEEFRNVVTDNTIDSRQKQELTEFLKSNLALWQGIIRGDDAESEDTKL